MVSTHEVVVEVTYKVIPEILFRANVMVHIGRFKSITGRPL